MVVKPAELTPFSALALAELAERAGGVDGQRHHAGQRAEAEGDDEDEGDEDEEDEA